MSPRVYFVQECPTCGRTLEILVDFLGREVACQHCRGRFVATDASNSPLLSDSGILMKRADELIAQAERRKLSPPHSNGCVHTH
jgi:hypothetical protein